MRISCLSDAVRVGVGAFAGLGLILGASGCLATRSWVGDQLRPITGQQERFQTQLSNAKREIDQFFGDMQGPTDSASPAPQRVFVVAGYTDSIGHEDYNYELGQRRATSVAGYLVGNKGLDPTQVRVVSYGASKPVDNNSTRIGRRKNRRVEILVYEEKIAS
jgi:outer membrane protein OmpA-like peptidoglycan-associated protein